MMWRDSADMPDRVLVTGAAGMIGSTVVRELIAHGYAVHAIDRRQPAPGVLPEGLVRFIEVDLLDIGQIVDAMRGCVAVVHLGAIPVAYAHPDDVVFRNNTQATFSVLQAASVLGITRAAFASSGAIYGITYAPQRRFPRWAPVTEDHPCDIQDAYALSKQVDEATASMFARRYGMSIAGLRFHWVTTREQQLDVVSRRGDAPTADGASMLFGYVDLRDVARACRLAIEVAGSAPFGFRAFNIAAADTLITVPTEEALRRLAPEVEIRSPLPGHSGGFDLSAAREVLGWVPEHSWRDDA